MIRPARANDLPGVDQLCRDLGLATPALPAGTLIAEHDGAITGYVQFHTLGRVGYVRHLAVRPPRTEDTGLPLMCAAAAALRAAGVREWQLTVEPDAITIRVYEQLGMQPEHRSTALRFPWTSLPALPTEPVAALAVSAEEDDDLERALGLLGGQIAMARRRTALVLRQLRDDTCAAVGFAALDPAGARIFKVARPTLAGPLLASLRPHAGHADLALVVDDHGAVTDLLVAHGAEIKLQLLHYRGALPAGG